MTSSPAMTCAACREALESLNMSLFLALGCQLHTAQRRCPPSHM